MNVVDYVSYARNNWTEHRKKVKKKNMNAIDYTVNYNYRTEK